MRVRKRILVISMALGACFGCGSGNDSVTIGAKDFAEQAILAEMAAALLHDAGLTVSGIRNASDSYQAQANLREGLVDVMVEYSGTALNLLGDPQVSGSSSIQLARELYEPLGLRWLDSLGFENGYAILVPSGRAAALGLRSIEDLSDPGRFPDGVRIACPPEFLRRPGDGLGPLVEIYGLRLASPPLVIADVTERMLALEKDRVDVAVGFATDGVISALSLRILEDPRAFFPSYEAAFVVSQAIVDRSPEIASALDQLSGLLDSEAMRQLNAQVELQGRRPALVAREFLIEQGLISEPPSSRLSPSAIELTFAVDGRDDFGDLRAEAIVAIRSAFSNRPIAEDLVNDPAEAVARGQARLALMGAERFFPGIGDDTPNRETRVEAVAVVGTRLLHLVRRPGDSPSNPFSGRVGVPPPGSGAGIIATRILGDQGEPVIFGDAHALLESLQEGRIDAAILLVPLGHSEELSAALSSGAIELQSLPNWLTPSRAVRMPFLRPARIAAGSYPGQTEPIETLGVQVLLAGPSRQAAPFTANSGPASALTIAGLPLSPEEIEALAAATGVPEAPDPTLPSAWSRLPADSDESLSTTTTLLSSVLNVLALVFLAWIFRLATQEPGPPSS